ncbi:MAG: O-antigen ligase family protein [Candidatus Paceibacterota bacterium]
MEVKKVLNSVSWASLQIIFGISFILIVLPSFSPFFDIPWNSKRFFQVILLLLIGLSVITEKGKIEQLKSSLNNFPILITILLSGILIFGIISSFLSTHVFYAFLEVSLFLLLLFLLLLSIEFYKNHERLFIKIFLSVLVLMVGLYFIRFSINYVYLFIFPDWPVWPHTQYFNLVINGESIYPKPFLGFVYERYLNHIHTWTLPIFIYAITYIPKRYWALRVITYLLTGFWWVLVFASDARGTMLSSLVSFFIVVVIFKKQIIEWGKTYAGTVLVGLFSYFLLFKLFVSEGGRSFLNRYSASGRFQMAENVFEVFLNNPLLGLGPMHYADFSNGFRAAHPHNFVLQIISEWGIVVFILSSIIFFYGYFHWIKFCKSDVKNTKENTLIKATLTASLTAGIIHSLVSGVMHSPLSQILAVLILGWTIGFYQKGVGINRKAGLSLSGIQKLGIRVGIISIVIFVSWATIYSYKGLETSRSIYLEQSNNNKLYPRFWDHGIIGVNENELDIINNDDSPD